MFFTGQPVFSQLLSFIPHGLINGVVKKQLGDRYCKSFKTYDHLITMLYCCFYKCSSLREVTVGMQGHANKLGQLGLRKIPRRSTLADANGRRSATIFEQLYHGLYNQYYQRLSDSRKKLKKEERLFIMDSTTISLFTDIMKGAGCPCADGRKKGGAKAHVLLDASNAIPSLIRLTESARNDRIFMKDIRLPKGSILVFDKGYHHFAQWQSWTTDGINWVTRLIDSEVVEVIEDLTVKNVYKQEGVIADQRIILGRGSNKSTRRITARLITYRDKETQKVFQFLTNNFRFSPLSVADIYADRWQIELFFKRFKQHSPLQMFLGNNENAIKIQIWCSFIAELLLKIIKDKIKRKWAFSNLAAIVRHHLMSYLNLKHFLSNPEKIMGEKMTDNKLNLFT